MRKDRLTIGARLLAAAAATSAVILVAAGLALSAVYERASGRGFDERLNIYLRELAADLAAPTDNTRLDFGIIGEPRFELPLSGWYWQIVSLESAPTFQRFSPSLAGLRLQSLAERGIPARVGERREATLTGPDERRIRQIERLVDLGEDGRYRVTVAGDVEELEADVADFVFTLWVTFGGLGLLLVLGTLVQVRYGLRPLQALRAEIVAVRAGERERLHETYPPDLAPLAQEVNQLLDSNREIVARARTQVGNLAHGLKTPLSVIRNEAEAAQGPLADKVREQAQVMEDQMSHYLKRARAAATANVAGLSTEAAPVCESLVRMFAKLNAGRDLSVAFVPEPGAGEARVRCERQDLEEMLGNLVDNACKWASSRVTLALVPVMHEGQARLAFRVSDDGPGLDADARAAVLRRGHRLDETKPGSGLGLSIVVELAGLYGGALILDAAPDGGLVVTLELPAV